VALPGGLSTWRVSLNRAAAEQGNRPRILADLQGFVERSQFWNTSETARNQTVMARFGTKLCTFRYLFDEKLARIALLFAGPKRPR